VVVAVVVATGEKPSGLPHHTEAYWELSVEEIRVKMTT
jgi:hypothetical protein